LAEHKVIPSVGILLTYGDPRVQLPAVSALTALAHKNSEVSTCIVTTSFGDKAIPDLLANLMGRDKSSKMQLGVAKCLTYLHRAGALPAADPKICMKTLSCLVRMCGREHDSDTRIVAAETLAYLIEVDKDLQSIAAISNHLIVTLSDYLRCQPEGQKPLMGKSAQMVQAAFRVSWISN